METPIRRYEQSIVTCKDWVTARNAANDFAGVGGKVHGVKEGFVATRNQFTKTFIVKKEVTES